MAKITTTSSASPNFLTLDELKREREFYRARGEVCPKDLPQANEEDPQQDDKAVNDTDYHRLDEQVLLSSYCSTLLILLLFQSYFCSHFVFSIFWWYSSLFIFLHFCLPLPILLFFFHLCLFSFTFDISFLPSPPYSSQSKSSHLCLPVFLQCFLISLKQLAIYQFFSISLHTVYLMHSFYHPFLPLLIG